MQLHGWGCGSTQDVLQGWQAGLVLRGQLGLLLLEDGQSEHITATHRGSGQEQRPEPGCKDRAALGEAGADPVLKGSPAKYRALCWVSFPHLTSQILQTEQTNVMILSPDDPQGIYSIKPLIR